MRTVLSLIVLFLVLNVSAQWNDDTSVNTLVVESEGDVISSVGASTGATFVVFWKVVAAPVNYELRMQILDTDGNRVLGDDGMLVSNEIPMSTYTVTSNVAIDNEDNLYIGITATGGGEGVFVFKIDLDGNLLWEAGNAQVGAGYSARILPLENGESIVAWLSTAAYKVELQRFDAVGEAIWSESTFIANGSDATSPADLYSFSNGDFMVVFHRLLSGVSSNLFAQRFNAEGVSQWAANTQLSNTTTRYNTLYNGFVEGDVLFYGYSGSVGNRFDSYIQRLEMDGSIPWGMNGVDFDNNQTDFEMYTQITMDPGANHLWAICTYTDVNQNQKGEKVQKIMISTGYKLLGDNAKFVFPLSNDYKTHADHLYIQNGNPVFLIENGYDDSVSPTTLEMVFLDPVGDFLFEEETFPVATYAANKWRIHMSKAVDGQNVIVFKEEKGFIDGIFAQNYMDPTVGFEEIESNSFQISYNNPVDYVLQITGNIEIQTVDIHTIDGRKIYSRFYGKETMINLSVAHWNAGVYMASITSIQGEVSRIKILKK